MLSIVDVDELRHALGGVVLEAAYLERILRAAFSALVGSKYAAVVDGRLMAAALIEDCERITRYHTGITEQAKDALLTAGLRWAPDTAPMNKMTAITIRAGATTRALYGTAWPPNRALTMSAPTATRTRKKVPRTSANRRRHS